MLKVIGNLYVFLHFPPKISQRALSSLLSACSQHAQGTRRLWRKQEEREKERQRKEGRRGRLREGEGARMGGRLQDVGK